MRKPEEDIDAIREALIALTEPGQTVEIRCVHERKFKGMQGFFDDPEIAADYVSSLDGDFKGIYFTLNPVDPDLMYRSPNKLTVMAEGLGAYDTNIVRRRWVPIDIDPVRVKGISSTATEHANALKLATTLASTLELVYGFPEPTIASSGNGAHILLPIDCAADDESRDIIRDFIHSVRGQFATPKMDIDTSVFNAARIWRLYGTIARKGAHTLERPHRTSKIIQLGSRDEIVPLAQLRDYTERHPVAGMKTAGKSSSSLYERSYPKDEGKYRLLNRAALDRLDEWVPPCFGEDARPYQKGYRVTSQALGRDLEEDLTIHPWPRGIKDFGEADSGESEEGRRTPITVIAEHMFSGDKDDAVTWLTERLQLSESEFTKVALKQKDDDDEEDITDVFKSERPISKRFNFNGIRDLAGLFKRSFKDIVFVVEDYLPEGAFFLIARPKMRKSWLVMQLGLAVATGGTFLGKKVAKGKVLGLFLEDNDRRIKRRLDVLYTFEKVPDLSNFCFWTPGNEDFEDTFPRGTDGCAVIRKWLEENPDCKLVIIDTWAHFRGHETGRNQNIYQLDYEAVMPLTRLAAEFGLTLIIVHHERKGALKETMDFIEDASGSTGLTGGVDGIMAIKGKRGISDENEVRQLAITGRDVINDYLLNISFDAELGGWRMAKRQDVGETIVALLRKYPVLKLSEMYGLMPNIPQATVRQQLLEMRHEGRVENTAQGYRLPPGA